MPSLSWRSRAATFKLDGLIPTGWYPDALALSPDGKYLGVSTLLGVGSGWKNMRTDPTGRFWPRAISPTARYVHSYRGTIHVIEIPAANSSTDTPPPSPSTTI